MMPSKSLLFCASLLTSLTVACGGTGTGKSVRNDVTTQMLTIESPVAKCYEDALKRSRKLSGTMVLSFRVEPKTGKFKDARVANSEVPDQELQDCVVREVLGLVLAKPQKTVVGIDSYPLRFSPLDE